MDLLLCVALKLQVNIFPPRLFPLLAGFTQLFGYIGAALSGIALTLALTQYGFYWVFFSLGLLGVLLFIAALFHPNGSTKR